MRIILTLPAKIEVKGAFNLTETDRKLKQLRPGSMDKGPNISVSILDNIGHLQSDSVTSERQLRPTMWGKLMGIVQNSEKLVVAYDTYPIFVYETRVMCWVLLKNSSVWHDGTEMTHTF